MAVSRLRASGGTLLGIVAVAALVSGFGVGAVAFLEAQGTAGIRSELAARSGADLALQASFAPAGNAGRQDSEVRAAIANSLAGSGVHFAVTRTLAGEIRVEPESESVVVEPGLAASIPDLADRAALVDGAFAERETEVAVQADAARLLGVSTGDTVLLDGARFTISGTWRANDALDPRWYGDSIVVRGFTDQYGPFAITEAAWSRLEGEPTISWTVVPRDVAEFTSTNLTSVIAAWSRIQTDWRGQVSDMQAFGVKRGLSQTLAELDARLDGQRAIEPVIFALLGALALITLSEVVGLLVAARSGESFLYWSRGRSPSRIAVRAAADVAAAAALGAVVGCALVALAPAPLGLGDVLGQLGARLWVVPVGVVAAAAVLSVIRSLRSTAAATSRDRGGRFDGRAARRVAVPGAVLLAVIAAGLSVWQLRLYGSPVTVSSDGRTAVDPLAVAAPAAALAALVLLAAVVLPLLAKAGERAIRRGRVPVRLAARSLSLHSGRFTAALVVVALAVGGTSVAAAYASTWATSYDAAVEFRVGADLHVISRLEGLSPSTQAEVLAVAGPGSVAPLESQPLSLGSVSGTIVAVSPEALSRLATTAGGLFDPDAAADDIRVDAPGPTVPEGASQLEVSITASGVDLAPAVSANLVDPMGFTSVVELEPLDAADGDSLVYRGDLPAPGPYTLLALDFGFPQESIAGSAARVRLVGIAAGTAGDDSPIDLGAFWIPGSAGVEGAPPTGDGTGLGMTVEAGLASARLLPSADGTEFDRVHPPVILSQYLAGLLGVGVGDTVSFALQEGGRVTADIAGVAPAIPGAATESALLLDLTLVQHLQLRSVQVPATPRDLWLAAASPGEVKDAVRPLLPGNTRIETIADPAARQVLGSPRTVFWAAAVCFVLLSLVAVASSLRARGRWGRNDVATLRALGLSVRDQRAIPVAEFSAVLVLGLLWGAASGALVAALTVPQIVRAAVPQRYSAIGSSVSWDVLGLAVLVVVLVAGLAVLLAGAARAVSRLARSAMPGVQDE